MSSFEEALQKSVFSGQNEKTFIDKLLAREDVNAIRELVKKPDWTRQDLLEILYLLSGAESKLLNYGEWERYVILKFFVWIREFVKIGEMLYDYEDDMIERGTLIKNEKNKDDAAQMFENNKRMIEHNIKFLVDLYLNIGRTSLSLGGTGFIEMLKNKFEVNYPSGQMSGQNLPQPQQSAGIFNRGK